jgi:sterol 3beta-glucosyltransferase
VELGVGAHALNRKTLSAESLAAGIAAMDDQEMRHRASAPGAAIHQEGGVTVAGDKVGQSA